MCSFPKNGGHVRTLPNILETRFSQRHAKSDGTKSKRWIDLIHLCQTEKVTCRKVCKKLGAMH